MVNRIRPPKKTALALVPDGYSQAVSFVDNALTEYLAESGLPSEGICVSIEQRVAVSRNFGPVLDLITIDARSRALYLSKFVAAVVVGLFDAALNYLWDETIYTLRRRVASSRGKRVQPAADQRQTAIDSCLPPS